MKKKFLFMGLFLVVMGATAFCFNSKSEGLEGLMLENIEALAAGEGSSLVHCIGTGSVDCPKFQIKVYCVVLYGN